MPARSVLASKEAGYVKVSYGASYNGAMLLQSQQLRGAQILSMHTGQVIGQLDSSIINPNKLELMGFCCATLQTGKAMPILLTQSIRQVGKGRVFIDSVDELTEPEELVRHQEIISLQFELMDKPVRTGRGKRLGKVDEYIIDSETWQIQKIYVRQSLFKNPATQNLIIDRTQVTEVSDKYITVADAYSTQPAIATPPAA